MQKSADKFLSAKSIERRKKSLGENSFLTYEDLSLNSEYISSLKKAGINIINKLKWFNAVSAYLSDEQLNSCKKFNFVENIQPLKRLNSYKRYTKEYSNSQREKIIPLDSGYIFNYGPSFNQYMLSSIPPVHNLGISGEGVIIGMLDAGFRRTHEAFNIMDIIAEWDFVNDDSNTANEPWEDPSAEGHGTFTLSLIGAFSEGNMVAPSFSSSYVLAKTENVDVELHIEEDNFAAALEWMDSIGVDITSSSLGYSYFDDSTYSYTYEDMDGQTTIVSQACNLAFERGIVTVTSAGNGGLNSWYYITAPADAFEIISVGAVTNEGENTWWHSRGPTYDGRLKPEVCAQGEGFGISAEATGGYTISEGIWGTSGACPIAAGIVGMLLSEFPHLNNKQVRSIVLQSGDNVINPDNIRGLGILSAVKAITFPNLVSENNQFSLNKIFINESGILSSSVFLNFCVGNNPYQKQKMNFDGGHLYTTDLPLIFNPDTIKFYFTYQDTLGNSLMEPEGIYYKFLHGEKIIELNLSSTSSFAPTNNTIVDDFILSQNYPNPFNPTTKIKYSIPQTSQIQIKVYDVLGNEIATLVDEYKPAGNYDVEFTSVELPSGVYFYQLQAIGFVETKKMILIK